MSNIDTDASVNDDNKSRKKARSVAFVPRLFDKKKRFAEAEAVHEQHQIEKHEENENILRQRAHTHRGEIPKLHFKRTNSSKSLSKTTSLSQVKDLLKIKDSSNNTFNNSEHETLEKIQNEIKKENEEKMNDKSQEQKTSPPERKFYRRFDLPDEKVIDNFVCALILKGTLLAQGSLYITQNYVCFYSNILRKKITCCIQFQDIICIRKCSLLKSIPNSIEIHTPEKKYTWTSLLHRQEAFELMDTRWRHIRKKLGLPIVDHLDTDEVEETLDYELQLEDDEVFICESCTHESPKVRDIPPRYTEIFSLSVEEFFYRFISNLSVPFWVEFIAKDGYDLSSCTTWEKTNESCCLEREIEFRTPIRITFSPNNSTRVVQKQRYRFLNQKEFIFETSSYSIDVPYSQQFLVESRWHIKQFKDDEHCELNISIGVRFTKKIFFKRVIEQTAIEGSRDWFKNWIRFAMSVVAQNEKSPLNGSSDKNSHPTSSKLIKSNNFTQKSRDNVVSDRDVPIDIKDNEEKNTGKQKSSFTVAFMVYFLMLGNKLWNIFFILLLSLVILLFGISVYYYFLSISLFTSFEQTKQFSSLLAGHQSELTSLLKEISQQQPNFYHNLENFHQTCLLEETSIWNNETPEEAFGLILAQFEKCVRS